jgi:hypothetical protein
MEQRVESVQERSADETVLSAWHWMALGAVDGRMG